MSQGAVNVLRNIPVALGVQIELPHLILSSEGEGHM